MLAGFNPADLARKAGMGRIEESARASVQVAGNSLADRLGAVEEKVLRTLAAWKGRADGLRPRRDLDRDRPRDEVGTAASAEPPAQRRG